MKDNFRFKIRGVDTLMSINDLINVERAVQQRSVKVIDMQTKKTWVTDYRTVKDKFG